MAHAEAYTECVSDADELGLSSADREAIEAHVREEYAGVFDAASVRFFLENHVGPGFAREVLPWVRRTVAAPAELLDVGSGYGAFVLEARRAGYDARGVELSDYEVAMAHKRLVRLEGETEAGDVFRRGDALDLPFEEERFDAVTLWNLLEHVPDAAAALGEAARVLRPGGWLFLICPNYAAFRREAHYQLPWPPLLPRGLAVRYLRWRGRDPSFFEDHIRYTTNRAVLRALRAEGVAVEPLPPWPAPPPLAITETQRALWRPGPALTLALRLRNGLRFLVHAVRYNRIRRYVRLHWPWQSMIALRARKRDLS